MPEGTRPFVSIIIPVYNDPDGIETTLRWLSEQTYPCDRYEILAVDNASTDQTKDVAEQIAAAKSNITVLSEPKQGSYAARNTGIEAADGEYLLFVDADMFGQETWVENMVGALAETDSEYLTCEVNISIPETESATLAGLYNQHGGFPIQKCIEEQSYAPTCCLGVSRTVIEEVGLFDDELVSGGDREFGNRVAEEGYSQQFDSSFAVTHPARTTIPDLIAKRRRIGRGQEQIYNRHPELELNRPIWNPKNFLPPSPRRYLDYRDDSLLSTGVTILLFFGLGYYLKLAQLHGRILERVGR